MLSNEMEGEPLRKRGRPSEGAREAILEATRQLLDDEGLARLTTRAVARRAGVSEASIFYHFGDKTALVAAALEASLESLREFAGGLSERVGVGELEHTLREIARRWEGFFDRALQVVGVIQADADLRADFRDYVRAHDYGVHRGVDVVAEYLEAEQALGRVRDGIDPRATAMQLLGTACLRALQRAVVGPRATVRLPSSEQSVATLAAAIATPPAGRRVGGRQAN
jgi:AcrR family transcriptional regulator